MQVHQEMFGPASPAPELPADSRVYFERGQPNVEIMGRGYAWLDTGKPDSMLDAAEFVRILEKRQGFKIASPDEIAFWKGLIGAAKLEQAIRKLCKSDYGRYLAGILSATWSS